jgi:hypothetical protein
MSKKRELRWLSRAISFFRNVTGRQKDELDTAPEVSAHLELLIGDKVRLGRLRSIPDESDYRTSSGECEWSASGGAEPLGVPENLAQFVAAHGHLGLERSQVNEHVTRNETAL